MKRRQVVILAGGLGTRLRPITETVPKPMVPVNGKPFLHWQLLDLKRQGYTDVLLLVAYLGEQVEKYFGEGSEFGMKIRYSFETEPLGTGGALKNALPLLAEEFFLVNGDSYLVLPLDEMGRGFDRTRFSASVSVYDNHDPVPVIPNLKVANGKVVAYEKDAGPARGYDKIDSGVYLMRRRLVEEQRQDKFLLAEIWEPLINDGRLAAFEVPTRFYDIGTVDRLAEFEAYLKKEN